MKNTTKKKSSQDEKAHLCRSLALAGACAVLVMAQVPEAAAQERRFYVYDGHTYSSDQLDAAMRSPVLASQPRMLSNGGYLVPRSVDGHYYISGYVNGFPVVFLVDTGAGVSVIPAQLAKNAGLRAGLVVTFETAAGRSATGVTEGNQVMFGPFVVNDAKVAVQPKLEVPLLGMDVLNRFHVTYSNGTVLKSAR